MIKLLAIGLVVVIVVGICKYALGSIEDDFNNMF